MDSEKKGWSLDEAPELKAEMRHHFMTAIYLVASKRFGEITIRKAEELIKNAEEPLEKDGKNDQISENPPADLAAELHEDQVPSQEDFKEAQDALAGLNRKIEELKEIFKEETGIDFIGDLTNRINSAPEESFLDWFFTIVDDEGKLREDAEDILEF